MPGANAYLLGTYDGASSGENGEFRFKTNKTGQQTLLVEFIGYESFSQAVELKGDTIRLNVKLKEAFNQLNAVTIIAGTFEASDKKQAVTITPIDMVTTVGAVTNVLDFKNEFGQRYSNNPDANGQSGYGYFRVRHS